MASTINSSSDDLPQRIPAWKRLGLKLKYAKENADEPPAPQAGAGVAAAVDSIHPERLRNIDQSNECLRPSKKRKTSSDSRHSAAKPTEPQSGVPHSTENLNGSPKARGKASFPAPQINGNGSISPRKSSPPTTLPRRKSVTFTEDTKQEDGISAKVLFNHPISTDPSPVVAESTETLQPTPKKVKKQRKSGSKASTGEPADADPPQYLQYLELFSNDRDNWKFNKNLQNSLLKHIFDVQRIPEEHNAAILQYLEGLKGANLRTRLIENATTILQDVAEKEGSGEEIAGMESLQAKRDAYGAALKRQLERLQGQNLSEYDQQQLEDMQREAASAKRAEEMLRLLLEQELRDGPARSATPATNSVMTISSGASNLSVQPQKKKRKNRTNTTGSEDEDSDSNDVGTASTSQDSAAIRKTPSSARSWDIPKKPVVPLDKLATGKKIIFDEEFLDEMFPETKRSTPVVQKRKREAEESESSGDSSDSSDSTDSTDSSDSSDSDSE